MQGSEVSHTFGQFIPRIWSSFSLSLSFLEFLLPLSSNYCYLKFCPLVIGGSKTFFFLPNRILLACRAQTETSLS